MRLAFGPFVFDSRLRAVLRDGAAVELSPKAFQLLESLVEARPAPVAKEVLYDRLWPKTFVEPGNLHNLIAEIRRALDDGDHNVVKTERGFGYSFDATDAKVSPSSSRFALCIREEVVHLKAGENIVGRDPDCAVVIDSPDVSRQHARLFVGDDHVVLEDLGSKNGTYAGSVRISAPCVLRGDEDLVVGRTRVLLRRRGNVKSTATAK